MRLTVLCCLAALAAGCSDHAKPDRAVLYEGTKGFGFRPKPVVHRVTDKQALGGARSARGSWIRDLNDAARKHPGICFRSPGREVLLARLEREARAHDFQVVSARMLRPRQLAPAVVVRTTHYIALARATGAILENLEPVEKYDRDYEGFYLEAQDERGIPFFSAFNVMRGRIEGGQWARSEPLYPFAHG
jgi:hypothetical protein